MRFTVILDSGNGNLDSVIVTIISVKSVDFTFETD